jgi:hypothetical protein
MTGDELLRKGDLSIPRLFELCFRVFDAKVTDGSSNSPSISLQAVQPN